MERLYLAASELNKVSGQSDLARLLNTSPQTVNNWESRGISADAALDAEVILGCSAVWVKKNVGQMHPNSKIEPTPKYSPEIEEIIKLLIKTDEIGQGKALWEIKGIVQMRQAELDMLAAKSDKFVATPPESLEKAKNTMKLRASEIVKAKSPQFQHPPIRHKDEKKQ